MNNGSLWLLYVHSKKGSSLRARAPKGPPGPSGDRGAVGTLRAFHNPHLTNKAKCLQSPQILLSGQKTLTALASLLETLEAPGAFKALGASETYRRPRRGAPRGLLKGLDGVWAWRTHRLLRASLGPFGSLMRGPLRGVFYRTDCKINLNGLQGEEKKADNQEKTEGDRKTEKQK